MKLITVCLSIIVSIFSLTICQCVDAKGSFGSKCDDRSKEIQYHDLIPDIHLQAETEEGNTWRCSFEGCGNIFILVLESNERLIADLPHSQRKQLLDKCKLFRGSIDAVPDSWVRLCKIGKRWSGMIWDGQELYILDPIRSIRHSLKQRPHPRASGTAMYKFSDVVRLEEQACGVGSSATSGQSPDDYQSLVDKLKELVPLPAEGASLNLDMSVVTDPLFSQLQEGTFGTPTIVAVAARINVVDGIYSEQVGVQIRLVDVIELENNGLLTSSNPSTLLSQFRNFVGTSLNNPGITHLFTGRDLNGSVIGIAFIGTVCDQSFGVGVDQIRGGGTSGALLVAHELGHNFGAPHDNQAVSPCAGTPGNFIMNPFFNGSDQFSQCSIDQMQSIINGVTCLTDIDVNQALPQDGIMDNGSRWTSFTGSWLESSGANSYPPGSVKGSMYSNEGGATHTYEASGVNGGKEVSLWWTEWSNRCTDVQVDIFDGKTNIGTAFVNHKANGGQWYSLGMYTFSGTARVVINSQGGCTTCADAMKIADPSSGPPALPQDGIMDNGSQWTSFTGSWLESSGANSYPPGSVKGSMYSNEGGATHTYEASEVNGGKEISLWWTWWSNRCPDVPVDIYDGSNLLGTVLVDHQDQAKAEQWYSLGTYTFTSGTVRVDIRSQGGCTTCADAVKIADPSSGPPALPQDGIMDNGSQWTSFTGSWFESSGANSYPPGSVKGSMYSNEGGATHTYEASGVNGGKEISLWWTWWSNRCPDVPVDIYDGSNLLGTVLVDHQDQAKAEQWYSLGTYTFTSGTARVDIRSQGGCTTCADAVMISEPSAGPRIK